MAHTKTEASCFVLNLHHLTNTIRVPHIETGGGRLIEITRAYDRVVMSKNCEGVGLFRPPQSPENDQDPIVVIEMLFSLEKPPRKCFLVAVTDKDRPSTWIKYRNGLCDGCNAACCTMPVEVRFDDLLRLKKVSEDDRFVSRRKVFRRLQKDGVAMSFREGTDLFMLQSKPNGDCPFLDENTRLCTDYANRPEVCRSFPSIGPRPGFCPRQSK